MARYNEILVGRFARAVQKLFGIKGEVPVGSLAGEVQIVHPILTGVENRFFESWSVFGVAFTVVANGAGNSGAAKIRNPAASNIVAVIEKFVVSPGTGVSDGYTLSVNRGTQADYATVQTPTSFDFRDRPNSQLISSSSTAGQAAAGTIVALLQCPTNDAREFFTTDIQERPLLPGSEMIVRQANANQAFNVTIWWRERFLEDSERS